MFPFSPPAWGWSGGPGSAAAGACVFPTRVGMVRVLSRATIFATSFPHPRGDGPLDPGTGSRVIWFSPPAWGWSAIEERDDVIRSVFPTRVGMVRGWRRCTTSIVGFPHPRGDGPQVYDLVTFLGRFSPPAWGWSGPRANMTTENTVFPTRVGMVRAAKPWRGTAGSFPHPRGDGPFWRTSKAGPLMFSPPAWGWSARSMHALRLENVFPTRVGMVRLAGGRLTIRVCFPHPRGDGP